jgi:hypothetical protein
MLHSVNYLSMKALNTEDVKVYLKANPRTYLLVGNLKYGASWMIKEQVTSVKRGSCFTLTGRASTSYNSKEQAFN